LRSGIGIVVIDAHQDGAARRTIESRPEDRQGKDQKRGAPQIRIGRKGHQWYDIPYVGRT